MLMRYACKAYLVHILLNKKEGKKMEVSNEVLVGLCRHFVDILPIIPITILIGLSWVKLSAGYAAFTLFSL